MKSLDQLWDSPCEGPGHFSQRFAKFFAGLAKLVLGLLFRFHVYGSLPADALAPVSGSTATAGNTRAADNTRDEGNVRAGDNARDESNARAADNAPGEGNTLAVGNALGEGKKRYIICGNHNSYLDSVFVLMAVRPRPLRFLAKQEFFSNKIIARLATWEGAFPINREVADTKAIKRAVTMLKRGELLGIYPEGTRNRAGNEQVTHQGITMIAKMAAADVIPVRIIGTDKISPPGSKRWHFPRVSLIFGKPLSLSDERYSNLNKSELYALFAQDCMDAVYSLEADS